MDTKVKDKVVIAYEKGYKVLPNGDVVGPSGNLLSLSLKEGYKRFHFRLDDGSHKHILVHRLLAYQKYGNELFKNNLNVCHIDSKRDNNIVDNIIIGSSSDNRYVMNAIKRIEFNENAKSTFNSYIKDIEQTSEEYRKVLQFIIKTYNIS